MAKTERRRQERAARRCAADAQATADPGIGVRRPTEQQWKLYDRVLAGLVDLDIDDTFVDLTELGPTRIRLVLHLNAIHASSLKALTHATDRALQAALEFCVFAEALRTTADHLDFWTRFFTSDVICRSFPPGHPVVSTTARYFQAHGVSLMVDLSGKRLHHPILKRIETVFTAPQYQFAVCGKNTSSPVFGLCFANCHLTAVDLEAAGRLLTSSGCTTSAFDSEALCLLDLSGNTFGTTEWEVLATHLSSPTTRCVAELKLDAVLNADDRVAISVAYREAFGRTITAVVTARNDHETSKAVSLSLANNYNIDATLMQTLRQVLEQATRPIAALSFAGCSMDNFSGWLQLGKLLFTSIRTCGDDCRLDLSRLYRLEDLADAVRVSLPEMVNEAIPRVIYDGIWARVPVRCRLLSPNASIVAETGESVDVELAQVAWYTIVRQFEHVFEIQIPKPDGGTCTALVPTSDVVALTIGDSNIVRFCFTSIVLDGDTDMPWRLPFHCEPLQDLCKRAGADLLRLSMRSHGEPIMLPSALTSCPRLHTLNFHDSHINLPGSIRTVWSRIGADIASNLQSLNVSSATLGAPHLSGWPRLTLRHLVLNNNLLCSKALASLRAILEDTPTLVHVEVDGKPNATSDDDEAHYAEARRDIDRCICDECITIPAKLAFLSVLDTGGPSEMLNHAVIADIFSFAGRSTCRQVLWST